MERRGLFETGVSVVTFAWMDSGTPRELREESVAQPKFEQDTKNYKWEYITKMDLERNTANTYWNHMAHNTVHWRGLWKGITNTVCP